MMFYARDQCIQKLSTFNNKYKDDERRFDSTNVGCQDLKEPLSKHTNIVLFAWDHCADQAYTHAHTHTHAHARTHTYTPTLTHAGILFC